MCKSIKTLTFIIKAVYSVYTGIFMVASQKEEIFRVFDLVGKKQTNGFQGLLPPVHIVPEEQVVGLRWEPSVLK